MNSLVANEPLEDELYLAGRRTSPGLYRELRTGRVVRLSAEDILPASLDGRVACYIRIAHSWGLSAPSFEARSSGS